MAGSKAHDTLTSDTAEHI